MIGENFRYGSDQLSDYGMMMVTPDESQQFVTREIERGDITALRAKPNHYTTVYTDTLTLQFLIMKADGCLSQDEYKLSDEEINNLRAWFESPKVPTELFVSAEDSTLNVHYFGVFTSVQPYIYEDYCYGLYLTFTCNAPYGYSDMVSVYYYINSSSSAITGRYINNSAEYNEYLKPLVAINSSSTFGDNETLTIENMSDDNKTMNLTLPKGLSKLIIDCERKILLDENGSLVPLSDVGVIVPQNSIYNFISTDMFVFYWLSFIAGENLLKFIPSSTNTINTIEISSMYAIKSGGF